MDPTPSSMDVPGLGRLAPMPDSPPGEAFWEGAFHYQDGGRAEASRFYLCVTDGTVPGTQQLDAARQILARIDHHLEQARALLKARLQQDPAFFGLDAADAARYLAKGDALLPFGTPEPTFYTPPEWHVRFAESPLPTCAQLGVMVAFQGERAVEVIDLSEDDQI